jgi:hypothetical protein
MVLQVMVAAMQAPSWPRVIKTLLELLLAGHRGRAGQAATA